ncbi:hypothetical protein WR25_13795 [Diploscapter pachys]|uniref:BHLH domain-containing protein n=1 Tax=Diploscapter pachys TaxID=2018661 RepID=A0A2A2JI18_9BILA|nr:hypothetical protein WR25_13795 [Diploscapter pachys]
MEQQAWDEEIHSQSVCMDSSLSTSNSVSMPIGCEMVEDEAERRTANVRERKRMCSINVAFIELRNYIPTFPFEKRLSKIDTLNLAIAYISMLEDILSSPIDPGIYVRSCVEAARRNHPNAPSWSTSDLLARLSWINWKRLGIEHIR